MKCLIFVFIRAVIVMALVFVPASICRESGRPLGDGRRAPVRVLTPYQKVTGVCVTAYTSRVEETDSTPFETASGTRTRDGVVGCNFLPIGTRLLIPEIFGVVKVFTVEDRMNDNYDVDGGYPDNRVGVDVLVLSVDAAKRIGRRWTYIVLLQ